jgi:hypothetical protein
MTKITLSTVKSFIRANRAELYINIKSDFDGMTDCCQSRHGGFEKVKSDIQVRPFQSDRDPTLGIPGAWFVGSSRDYFSTFEDGTYRGIEVSNCCGYFVLAVKK